MKIGRVLGIAMLGVAVAALGVAVAAFNGTVQTWLLNQYLAGKGDAVARVGRIEVGFRRLALSDVHWESGGIVVILPSLEAHVALSDLLKKDLRIERLSAKGWKLDASRYAATSAPVDSAKAAAANQAGGPAGVPDSDSSPGRAAQTPTKSGAKPSRSGFSGIFHQLELPVALSVDEADLAGELIFRPHGAKATSQVRLSLQGRGLGSGKEAVFTLSLAAATKEDAPVSSLGAKGRLELSMDTPRSLCGLGLAIEADAQGRQIPQGAKLSLSVKATKLPNGESYDLELGTGGRRLAELHTQYAGKEGRLSGGWKLDLKRDELLPFSLGIDLPHFQVQGEGLLSLALDGTDTQLSGNLRGEVDRLGIFARELEDIGVLRGQADFDMALRGPDVRVTRLEASIQGTKPVARLAALQGFEYGTSSGELRVADPAKDLMRLELLGVPLVWLRPWFGDYVVEGQDIRATVALAARNGGLGLKGEHPVILEGLTISKQKTVLADALDLQALISAEYSTGGWQLHIQELALQREKRPLVSVQGRVGRLAGAGQSIKTEGRGKANLGGLASLPSLTKSSAIAAGMLDFDLIASLGTRQELQANLTIRELKTSDPESVELPEITGNLHLHRAADGAIAFELPMQIAARRAGRISDVGVSGGVVAARDAVRLDLALTSQFLALEDAIALAALTRQSENTQGAETLKALRTPVPDPRPFWAGLSGKISVAAKRVTYGADLELGDVFGNITLDGGALTLENVKATLPQGARISAKTALRFEGKSAEPYRLGGEVLVDDFESRALLPKESASMAPSVEASFDMNARLEGTGRTLGDLVGQTKGSLTLTSKSGICRLLRADVAEALRNAQKGTSIVGNIGAMLGSDRLSNYVSQAQTVGQIAKLLEEVPFDQLSMTMTRDAEMNLRLQELTLISPQLRLGGSGEIRHAAGVELTAQPLDLRLQLGVRGELAQLMTKVGLLDGRQDSLGYQSFASPLRIGGSLRSPDNADLKATLVKAASGSLLNSLLKR